MIKLLMAAALSLPQNTSTPNLDLSFQTHDRPIKVTFDPELLAAKPALLIELERLSSLEDYNGPQVVLTRQDSCNLSDIYVTDIEDSASDPNVGILTTLNVGSDPTMGGIVKISVENIEFSNSINEPRDEFTPASLLLNSFAGESTDEIDPGYATICNDNLTQCVTLVR